MIPLKVLNRNIPHLKQFQVTTWPCGSCIECRALYAQTWGITSVHEAQMYEQNCFITLTYRNDALKSNKLIYKDFQDFMKSLRNHISYNALKELYPNVKKEKTRKKLFAHEKISVRRKVQLATGIRVIPCGEYGPSTKRPHWHALIFNYRPRDLEYIRTNEHGDKLYRSAILDAIWGKNDPQTRPTEIGQVTYRSANYVARYALKKLEHKDKVEEYKPITVGKSKGIGKKWLEKFKHDVFDYGELLYEEKSFPIPRRMVRQLEKIDPILHKRYVTQILPKKQKEAALKAEILEEKENEAFLLARELGRPLPLTNNEVREIIKKEKLKHNKMKME